MAPESIRSISTGGTSRSMKYEPALDGLRAVAILGVLAFHVRPSALEGGFTGVDVFFVLSGYLITSVILHDIRGEKFSMREFYTRRIQRLLPNAAITVLATVLLTALFLLPSRGAKVADHGLLTVFNLSNFYILKNVGGYWGELSSSTPLLHTWSLAVEEQFYLAFPATLSACLFFVRGRLFALTLLLTIASFLLSLLLIESDPSVTFYMLPTRAWEPLMGAALATYRLSPRSERPLRTFGPSFASEALGWSGISLIVAGFFFVSEDEGFPGMIALVPTLGSLAVLFSIADGKTRIAKLLSHPVLVWIGALSYSIYLWHWPLIVIGRNYAALSGHRRVTGTLIGAALGVALAVVAYWTIEKPLRQRGEGRPRRLMTIGAILLVCVATCLGISLRDRNLDLLDRFDRPVFRGMAYDAVTAGDSEKFAATTRFRDVEFPETELHPPDSWKQGGIVHEWGDTPPRVVVLGSSHALMYGGLIDDLCKELGISVAFMTSNGISVFSTPNRRAGFPTVEKARQFYEARRRWLTEWKPDVVFLIDRWDSYGSVISDSDFDGQVRDLVDEFSPLANRLVFFSQVPVLALGDSDNLREFVTWRIEESGSAPRISQDRRAAARDSAIRSLEAVADSRPEVRLLRAEEPFFRADGSVRYSSGRSFFYADDDHLSQAGAEQLRNRILEAISPNLPL